MFASAFLCERFDWIAKTKQANITRVGIGGLRRVGTGPVRVTLAVVFTFETGEPLAQALPLVLVTPDGAESQVCLMNLNAGGHAMQSWIAMDLELDRPPGPYLLELRRGRDRLCAVPFEILR